MDETAIKAIRDLSLSGVGVRDINGMPVAILPDGIKATVLNVLMKRPDRIRESFQTHDYESFLKYIAQFAGSTKVDAQFCSVVGTGLSAEIGADYVFDYHESDGSAGNKDHTAKFRPIVSREWEVWTSMHGKMVPQDQFADFIESNIPDIHIPASDEESPSGATMLSLAKELQLTASIDVDSRVDRSSGGVSFRYAEKVDGRQNGKQVKVPEYFHIAIPMHVNGPAYVVKALFRYRRQDQHVRMGVELYRHHKLYEVSLAGLVAMLGKDLNGKTVFL